ncbi:MAG: hypothetical protein AAFQ63_12275 [Cyanobacteria bacterium J06621_11]
MRRLLLILLATAPLTGCQYLSAGEDIEIIDPFEGADEAISAAGDTVAQTLNGEAAEESVLTEAEAEVPPVVTADLIKSTDPEARTRQVSQSRIDPFAVLPIPLAPEPVVAPTARTTGASGNGSGGNAAATATATRAPETPEPTPPPVRVQDPNEPLVRPSSIVALPRIPQPVVAPTIAVSGIVQLGGEPYAIVSSSSEPERYVRVGDRLAGGSVRVKRIDTMAFEPQVILEENGIEVSRPVGNGGAADEADPDTPGDAPTEASTVPVAAIPAPPIAVPATATSVITVPTVEPASNALPQPGFVPGSLLLQPPEVTSQVTLPNMQIAVPGTV